MLNKNRMRIKISLIAFMLIFALMLAGCSLNSMQEPPEISIHIGDKEIEYVSAKNKWDGSVYDREDTFIIILKEQNEIPVFENGSIAEIVFSNNPPDEFMVMDILINEDGNQIYTDKEIKNIPVESNDGKYSFDIEYHFASSLSSFYEPGKTDIRGFRMIASWGENECEYAFVVRTYTKSLEEQNESESSENEIDRSEYLTGEIITDGEYSYPTKGFGYHHLNSKYIQINHRQYEIIGTPNLSNIYDIIILDQAKGTLDEFYYDLIENKKTLYSYITSEK